MLITISTTAHPFPRFVAQLSQQDNFITTLSALRKMRYFNTNMVLYAIWFARAEHGRLQKPYLRALFAAVHSWHDQIIRSLIDLLQVIHQSHLAQKVPINRMVEIELQQADRLEQQLLAETQVPAGESRRGELQKLSDACFNIMNYCKLMQIPLTEESEELLIRLLQLSFPEIKEWEIARNFKLVLETAKIHEKIPAQLRLQDI